MTKTMLDQFMLYLHGSAAFQILHAGMQLGILERLKEPKSLETILTDSGLPFEHRNLFPLRSHFFGLGGMGLITNDDDEAAYDNRMYTLSRQMSRLFENSSNIDGLVSAIETRNKDYKRFKKLPTHIENGDVDLISKLMKNSDFFERLPKNLGNELFWYVNGATAFQIMRSGVKFGIFEAINEGHRELSEIHGYTSESLNVCIDKPAIQNTLQALDMMNLVYKKYGRYYNNRFVSQLFKKGQWDLITKWTAIEAEIMYVGQQDYAQSLVEGRNVGLERFKGSGTTIYHRLTPSFFPYMEAYSEYARTAFMNYLKQANLPKKGRLLDVGCGAGGNAIAFAKAYPGWEITAMDLRSARKYVEENIAKEGVDNVVFENVSLRGLDYPAPQDIVIAFHQYCIWKETVLVGAARRAYNALKPGGRMIIYNTMVDDNEQGPLMPALDAVYFFSIATGEGMNHSVKTNKKILQEAGFTKVEAVDARTLDKNLITPHTFVIGYKGS